jgi:hypothetical protein
MTKKAPTGIRSTAPLALFNIANNFAIPQRQKPNYSAEWLAVLLTSTSQESTWCSRSSNEIQVTHKTSTIREVHPGIGRPD